MTRTLLFLLLLCAPFALATAQEDILKSLQEDRQVRIELDSLLESNYNKQIAKSMKSSGIPGYRIRIYSESGIGAKDEQQKIRARFLSLFPGLDAYNRYDEPYFKIYVGDCRTRSEAIKLDDSIRREFPNTIIVRDHINLKSAD